MKNRPKDTDWIDIHSHSLEKEEGIFRVYNLFLEDFNRESLPDVFSCGLHPWHIKSYKELSGFTDKLREVLDLPEMIAIGEAGLDKIFPVDMEAQIDVFVKQVELSEEYRKPMIIHCVKAFQELLKIRSETGAQQPWVLHGFNSSPQLAGDLVQKGFYISSGPRMMNDNRKCKEVLDRIPIDRLLVETDAEDMDLLDVYSCIAGCLDLSNTELRAQIQQNYLKLLATE